MEGLYSANPIHVVIVVTLAIECLFTGFLTKPTTRPRYSTNEEHECNLTSMHQLENCLFLEAIQKPFQFYKLRDIDMFKDGIRVPDDLIKRV